MIDNTVQYSKHPKQHRNWMVHQYHLY